MERRLRLAGAGLIALGALAFVLHFVERDRARRQELMCARWTCAESRAVDVDARIRSEARAWLAAHPAALFTYDCRRPFVVVMARPPCGAMEALGVGFDGD